MPVKYDVEKIVRGRVRRGWTQTQLARFIGKSSAAVSKIERGEFNGTPTTIKRIADCLGIPMEELILGSEPTRARAGRRREVKMN